MFFTQPVLSCGETVLIHKCCWVPWIYCEVGTFVWVGQELWVELVWEAGIRSGVTVVTFGMCEIQDWNLKL